MNQILRKSNSMLSFFHLNISSLPFHYEEFSTILSENKLNFDVLGISESRLRLNTATLSSIQLPGYNLESTPTESTKGGTLLYIKSNFKYKRRNDLEIYKSKVLESTFIEINQQNKDMIVGCIYCHLCLEL